MFDYDSIKELAKVANRPTPDVLALAPNNDPFIAGIGYRRRAAEWFADIWSRKYGTHLRRIHYVMISQPKPILMPNGREYQNTLGDWNKLIEASRDARYLDLIPADAWSTGGTPSR